MKTEAEINAAYDAAQYDDDEDNGVQTPEIDDFE